jgi:uncharacterized phage protein (TIGR02220 family)
MITLLLLANHEKSSWEWMGEKFEVNPGQFVTSLESIRKKTGKGISIQSVRSCLLRLQKLQFATNKATKAGRLITIVNWDSYQPKNKKATKIATNEQQRSNKGATPNKNERKKEEEIYSRVVSYLNKKTGSKFRVSSKKTQSLINTRLKEGHQPEDFKTVIDNKTIQWLGDPENERYLRPETLFGTKFESYLNEKKAPVNGKSFTPKTQEQIDKEKRDALL